MVQFKLSAAEYLQDQGDCGGLLKEPVTSPTYMKVIKTHGYLGLLLADRLDWLSNMDTI